MSVEATGAPPVAEPAPPAAVPPKPPAAQSDDPALLKTKLELVQADLAAKGQANARLNETVQNLTKQLDDLKKSLEKGKTQKLEDQGEYERLYNEQKQAITTFQSEIAELKQQLTDKDKSFQQERVRSASLLAMRDPEVGVLQPEQMLTLLGDHLRDSNGKPVVLHGGVEVPIRDYLMSLKQPGSGFEHHFSASGMRGMGSSPSAPTLPGGAPENPWRTGNLTHQLLLLDENPDLARQFQLEASQG